MQLNSATSKLVRIPSKSHNKRLSRKEKEVSCDSEACSGDGGSAPINRWLTKLEICAKCIHKEKKRRRMESKTCLEKT